MPAEDSTGMFVLKRAYHGLPYQTDLFARVTGIEVHSTPPLTLHRTVFYTVGFWETKPVSALQYADITPYNREGDGGDEYSFRIRPDVFDVKQIEASCITHFLRFVLTGEKAVDKLAVVNRMMHAQNKGKSWNVISESASGSTVVTNLGKARHLKRWDSLGGKPLTLSEERAFWSKDRGVEQTALIKYTTTAGLHWFDRLIADMAHPHTYVKRQIQFRD